MYLVESIRIISKLIITKLHAYQCIPFRLMLLFFIHEHQFCVLIFLALF